jgi:hypothetical protein
MAALYDSEVNRLLDQLIPCRRFVVIRIRPTRGLMAIVMPPNV